MLHLNSDNRKSILGIKRTWLAILTPPLFIVLFIWLPFGFTLTGLLEEWSVLGLFATHGLFFVADTSSPLFAHALRPLTVFPHALAYFFDPNSFNYWHVSLIIALMVKGSASSHLIWKATGSIRWAMVMGVLVLVYPADTMQLSFRALHINLALSILLLASSVLIIAYEKKHQIVAYSLVAIAAVFLFIACCMYEASLMLIPLPLMIMFVRSGFQAFFYQVYLRLGLLLVWVMGAGFYIIYVIFVSSKIATYQGSITHGTGVSTLVHSLPKLFSVAALRSLFGGWFDAIRMVVIEFNGYSYLMLSTIVIGALIFVITRNVDFNRQNIDNSQSDKVLSSRLALIGLIAIILGYAPFLLLPSHQVISQRTFLFVTPGAAMVWIAVLIFISRSTKLLAELIVLVLIFFGLGMQLFQFNHYVKISQKQDDLLRSIVENFDGNLGDNTLLLLDKSNQLGHTWMFSTVNLSDALSYIYGFPVKSIEVCHMPSKEWQHVDDVSRKGTCVEEAHDWLFRFPGSVSGPGYISQPVTKDIKIAKDKIVSITINEDGNVSQNPLLDSYRKYLLSSKTTTALRYRNILAKKFWPLNLIKFENKKSRDDYRWNFGDWWSLELPIRGSGWREAEWTVNNFYHQSSAWKSNEKSSLYFDFLPTDTYHILHGKFDIIVNDNIRNSMKISINGNDLTYSWISYGEFEAKIKPGIMINGINEISFNSNIDLSYYGLSARLDWFDIKPLKD